MDKPLLKDLLPHFADELEKLLITDDLHPFARQIDTLCVYDRCRCADDFCASFYTKPKPDGAYGSDHRNIEVNPSSGMIILDVVDEIIVHIEVLFRDEIRDQLIDSFP